MKDHVAPMPVHQRMKQVCKNAMVNANLHMSAAMENATKLNQKNANIKSMYFVHWQKMIVRKPSLGHLKAKTRYRFNSYLTA
jgi:hypothetical protein